MRCKNCGAELENNAKFCGECGHEVMRDRTFIDPLPELDEYRRVRNKVYLFDEHSKPLNIYCFVMIAIFAVIFIVGFILKLMFLPMFSGIFIGILLLMLWANNRKSKRVRFAVGRPLVVILPLLMIQLIFVSVFMYKTRDPFDDPFFAENSLEDYSEDEESTVITYESGDGWRISCDTEKFSVDDTLDDGQVCFNYTGSGMGAVVVSYFPDRMPNEILYEKTADIDDARIIRGEAPYGSEMYWSHFRFIMPENESSDSDDLRYEELRAIEHNGGTVLIDLLTQGKTGSEQYAETVGSISEMLGTFELVNHEPQTEYAYMTGKYSRSYDEEIDGETVEITESVVLNDDHTCEVTFEDTVGGEWSGTELHLNDGQSFEISVEGDSLYINMNDEWIEFKK